MKNAMAKPTGTFKESIEINPGLGTESDKSFKIKLFNDGIEIGWMGVDSGEWTVLTEDESKATIFTQYTHKGINYYRTKEERYLSINTGAYVGLYGWWGACGWKFKKDGRLKCLCNNQHLSFYSKENGYLYAWDAYAVLTVEKVF